MDPTSRKEPSVNAVVTITGGASVVGNSSALALVTATVEERSVFESFNFYM